MLLTEGPNENGDPMPSDPQNHTNNKPKIRNHPACVQQIKQN